ncbi:MAG: hypothetical protein AAGD25_15270 [Cyanobacteria bacterium P01_F01_bin.150]
MIEKAYVFFNWMVFGSLVFIAIAFLLTIAIQPDWATAVLGCIQAVGLAAIVYPRTPLPPIVKPLVLFIALFVV